VIACLSSAGPGSISKCSCVTRQRNQYSITLAHLLNKLTHLSRTRCYICLLLAGCTVTGQTTTCRPIASLPVGSGNAVTYSLLVKGSGASAFTGQRITTYVDFMNGAPNMNATIVPTTSYVTLTRTCAQYNPDGSPFSDCTPTSAFSFNSAAANNDNPDQTTCCVSH
jgi:hypothetical protein